MRPQPYVNKFIRSTVPNTISACLLYTSDAADE